MSAPSETPHQMVVTRWWWVRHAPVVDAKLGKLSGQFDIDTDLSDTASFAAVAARLPLGAVWITTNLKRTRQTAEALWQAGAERIEPLVETDFAEQAFGAWTSKTWAEIDQFNDAETQAFWADPANVAPPPSANHNSESFAAVCARVSARLQAITAENSGRDIVCVAHAGAIRAAVAHALGLSAAQALALDVKNTSLTRLDHIADGVRVKRGGSWRVVGLNMI
ncbi:histidine phosphatase family protein [Magnetovibrio sp.]|uniref:histidine phosphatase family protein n=1 Tax=Magnetovibrio sp. TaxID=2024836 RepID=UPI002F93F4FE